MATDTPQRAYRAPCPGCGAPVEFRSAQSTHAICAFCHSTVVRDGDTLSRIGKMAEVFEDYSPLQLQASGVWQGKPFTLVGRLQYKASTGAWTEWNAVFGDASLGTLAEDNGAFVFALPATFQREVPAAAQFRVGATTAVGGKAFSVASNEQVALVSAQGELPKLPALGAPFSIVELRSEDGEVLSIDYGSQPPALSRGRAVLLDELALTGLKAEAASDGKARQFACPNCGAPVAPVLPDSKTITCPSCHSLIDLSQGVGGELRHAVQDEPVQPVIALGSIGTLQGAQWQVVGFQHRMGHDPQDDDGEQFGWDEYLLYNQKRGFTFLVDAEEGWSIVKPVTGAPKLADNAKSASYLGASYALKYSYQAETTYALGEFYWPVERGQKTFNRDFASGRNLLSQEQTPREVTWSSGSQVDSGAVAVAFKLQDKADLLKRADAAPSSRTGIGCLTVIMIVIVILILLALLRACARCDPATEYCGTGSGYSGSSGGAARSSGGSFGGFSGGGGHK